MNTAVDAVSELDTLVGEDEVAVEQNLPGRLPFAYAKANQAVLEINDESLTLVYVAPLATDTLLEVRRCAGRAFSLEAVEESVFQSRLTGAYQRSQN